MAEPPDHFSRRVPDGDNRERLVCDSCGFVSYENPKVVVGSVCTWGERILLCKRAIEPRRGFWTLPAGYLEVREATGVGAAREAWEEALARIEIDALLAVYNIPRISQVQVIYRARLLAPTSPPGRRARRSACSPGTRSPGRTSPSPACAGRCTTSARCATSASSPLAPTRRASTGSTDRGAGLSGCELAVLAQHAAVHHHQQSGRVRPRSRVVVDDADLHPHRARADRNRVVDDRPRVIGAAEDVDHLHRRRHGAQVGGAGEVLPG